MMRELPRHFPYIPLDEAKSESFVDGMVETTSFSPDEHSPFRTGVLMFSFGELSRAYVERHASQLTAATFDALAAQRKQMVARAGYPELLQVLENARQTKGADSIIVDYERGKAVEYIDLQSAIDAIQERIDSGEDLDEPIIVDDGQ